MARASSFHHCNDGRGKRRVYVNGNEIERVVWCDTAQGIAWTKYAKLRILSARDIAGGILEFISCSRSACRTEEFQRFNATTLDQ
ncbi:hypothetical protein ACVWVZ_004767 [Pseudomonas tolaasii]